MAAIGWEGVPRIAEMIRRFTGQDEVVPGGIVLENDRPEWGAIRGERLWTTGPVNVGNAVGNLSRLQIQNPSPNMIVVIVGVAVIFKATAGVIRLTKDGAGVTAAIAKNIPRDQRVVGITSANAPDSTLPAISGTEVERFSCALSGDGVMRSGPYILAPAVGIAAPGRVFDIINNTANEALTALAWGYERVARDEERVA